MNEINLRSGGWVKQGHEKAWEVNLIEYEAYGYSQLIELHSAYPLFWKNVIYGYMASGEN